MIKTQQRDQKLHNFLRVVIQAESQTNVAIYMSVKRRGKYSARQQTNFCGKEANGRAHMVHLSRYYSFSFSSLRRTCGRSVCPRLWRRYASTDLLVRTYMQPLSRWYLCSPPHPISVSSSSFIFPACREPGERLSCKDVTSVHHSSARASRLLPERNKCLTNGKTSPLGRTIFHAKISGISRANIGNKFPLF